MFSYPRTLTAQSPFVPDHIRCLVARQAAEFLIDRGALLVLISVSNGEFYPPISRDLLVFRPHMSALPRPAQFFELLNLKVPTKRRWQRWVDPTRRGFRYQLRRIEEDFGASLVVQPEMTESAFLFLNRNSAFPVSRRTALWRFRKTRHLSNSVFLGLRAADGEWLSALGGRRQGDLTEIDWQSNLKGLDRYSLVSAMRAHLLQYEIDRGTRFLRFCNGTPHPMQLYFRKEKVSDLLLFHPLLSSNIMRKVLPRLLPTDNLLSKVVREGSLAWHSLI